MAGIVKSRPTRRLAWSVAVVIALLAWACHLQEGEKEHLFSFTKHADSLSRYDSVLIIITAQGSAVSDTIFRKRVESPSQLADLKAPNFRGGEAVIVIIGYSGNRVAYEVAKTYDAETKETLDTVKVVVPGTTLRSAIKELRLKVGEEISLPAVAVEPEDLASKELAWSAGTDAVIIDGNRLKGWKAGSGEVVAALKSDASVRLAFPVFVTVRASPPERLTLAPDTLRVAVDGASKAFQVAPFPASAGAEVAWHSRDTTVARVTQAGVVTGVGQGTTGVVVVSREDSLVRDTAVVIVTAAVKVESVRFLVERLEVYVGGAAESLAVEVLPALADQQVTFASGDSTVAQVRGGRVFGSAVGETRVTARSARDTSKSASILVSVKAKQAVDGVEVLPAKLTLYIAGPDSLLIASVLPASVSGKVRWTSTNPAAAAVDDSGRVAPVGPGAAFIVAASAADSGRKDSCEVVVKRDMPRLAAGRDTTVPVGKRVDFRPTAEQEYGAIVLFKWDLDGDGAWDDSAQALKTVSHQYAEEKEYLARFRVRDTEGNDTVAVKKVKAVRGPVVLILEPEPGSYTNKSVIDVVWTVNDTLQPASKTRLDREGPNTVKRSVRDGAGVEHADSIVVHLDTKAPEPPARKGSRWSNQVMPVWAWGTGGGGGAGVYRCRLDNQDLAGMPEIADSAFTPPVAQTEETHTLYVQERDRAGNWSASAPLVMIIDTTRPLPPKLQGSGDGLSNDATPTWNWMRGGTGMAAYRVKVDDQNLAVGALQVPDSSYTPASALPEGRRVLYVQERDSAGNWSETASRAIVVDVTPPGAPSVTALTGSPTNDRTPDWKWSPAGGGSRNFEATLDTTAASFTALADTAFSQPASLPAGTHTLHVRERDAAGNWSAWGRSAVTIDLTPPEAPVFGAGPVSPLNSSRPVFAFAGGGGGSGVFLARFNDTAWGAGSFAPVSPYTSDSLADGAQTLYLRERDAAGNWSPAASRRVVLARTGLVGGTHALADVAGGFMDLAVGTKDQPYAIGSRNSPSAIAVSRFEGSAWKPLPSPGEGIYYNLIIQDTVPYLAFCDAARWGNLTVKRYEGSAWVDVVPVNTQPEGTALSGAAMDLVLGPGNTPTVAGYSYTYSPTYGNLYTPRVYRASGTTWKELGTFIQGNYQTSRPSLAVAADGTIYFAHADAVTGKLLVARYQEADNKWIEVGTGLPTGPTIRHEVSFGIGAGGALYLSYAEEAGSQYKPVVKTLSGGAWVEVGDVSQFQANTGEFRMVFDPEGAPVVVLRGTSFTLATWKNGAWKVIGKPTIPLWMNIAYLCAGVSGSGVPYFGGRYTEGNPYYLDIWKVGYEP